ncbi:hypothetical protein KFK14_14690 [Sphingobium phenoxybenzoativorans]|uniref:Uncharacterized protein n=1 Tax=Sphingobium phenoxybenzoativorans TaxID=1592790 RepID=A0A975K568_9SPHN|nr:hypothetical protein [Sphingobium phenoxybenzoativorans]QUT04323.1 hypothetical protein KFK14_14690 [Sphingobium phenoxybenzoativorans]
MARGDFRTDPLILHLDDRYGEPARPAWTPLFYALFASAVVMLLLGLAEWARIPEGAKRDMGAVKACQQHLRYKLPPEPGLEIVSFAVQPAKDMLEPRSVLLAYRALNVKGPDGRPRQGMQQCAFATEADGNFPPFKELSRAVFRSEGEMQAWKEQFLRGETVEELEAGRPECCLPLREGRGGNIVTIG